MSSTLIRMENTALASTPGAANPDRLITRAEVERITGLARSEIYRQMASGSFPRPYRVGSRAVRWSLREVLAWVASRPRS